MKAIELDVDEYPCGGTIAEDGQYVIKIYTSDQCDGELEEAIKVLAKLWNSELSQEVCLNINVKVRDIFKEMFDGFSIDGAISKEDMPFFEALYKDCKWIVDQIEALKVEE